MRRRGRIRTGMTRGSEEEGSSMHPVSHCLYSYIAHLFLSFLFVAMRGRYYSGLSHRLVLSCLVFSFLRA